LTGSLEYHIIEKIEGYNSLEMMINFALTGEMHSEMRGDKNSNKLGCNITFLAFPGKINKIVGEENIRTIKEVIDIVFVYKEGDEIESTAMGTLRQVIARVFVATSDILK